MALIACNCPNCNGQLDFDDSREVMFCSYCGTKVLREQVVNVTNNITIADGYQIHDADWYYETLCALFLRYDRSQQTTASNILEQYKNNYPLDDRIKYFDDFYEKNPPYGVIRTQESGDVYGKDKNHFHLLIFEVEKNELFRRKVMNPYIQTYSEIKEYLEYVLKNCLPQNKSKYEHIINEYLFMLSTEYANYANFLKQQEIDRQKEKDKNMMIVFFAIAIVILLFVIF